MKASWAGTQVSQEAMGYQLVVMTPRVERQEPVVPTSSQWLLDMMDHGGITMQTWNYDVDPVVPARVGVLRAWTELMKALK